MFANSVAASRMESVADVGLPSVAPCGLLIARLIVSAGSVLKSLQISTSKVFEVSPAAKFTVPEAATKSGPGVPHVPAVADPGVAVQSTELDELVSPVRVTVTLTVFPSGDETVPELS